MKNDFSMLSRDLANGIVSFMPFRDVENLPWTDLENLRDTEREIPMHEIILMDPNRQNEREEIIQYFETKLPITMMPRLVRNNAITSFICNADRINHLEFGDNSVLCWLSWTLLHNQPKLFGIALRLFPEADLTLFTPTLFLNFHERSTFLFDRHHKSYQGHITSHFPVSENGSTEFLTFMLGDGRFSTEWGSYALQIAVENEQTKVALLLLSRDLVESGKVDPSVGDNFAIRMASAYGLTDVVRLLLSNDLVESGKVDPSARDNMAIRWASENGRTDVVRLLLSNDLVESGKVDPSAEDNYSIRWASLKGYTYVVRLLLSNDLVDSGKVDPSARDNEAIRLASNYGRTDVVRLLLSNDLVESGKVDPSAEDNKAIMWASRYGRTDIMRLLLSSSRS